MEIPLPTPAIAPLWNSLMLDRQAPTSLQDQIVAYFRAAALSGRLPAGTRLPSSRELARDQGLARITVVQAYDRLVAEGYVAARAGAGMYVADDVAAAATPRPVASGTIDAPAMPQPEVPLPLTAGIPALDRFPWADWAKAGAAAQRGGPAGLLAYGDPGGAMELRAAIANYVAVARGITCTPDQVIVISGAQQGIDLVARTLLCPGDAVWFEEPGYVAGRSALAAAGLQVVPVPVDGDGMDVAIGLATRPDARLALVAPTHQYPLGATLSLGRRLALLDWAEGAGAWVVEDDYDGEYRYGGRPLTPLHTLDGGRRVLYLGTFSKVLAPGLRLGYLIVPPALVGRFTDAKWMQDRGAPALTQQTLARFITQGRLAAHVRRMRPLYRARRQALLAALADHAADVLDAAGNPDAGLHLVARLRAPGDDGAIAQIVLARGVKAAPLSAYYHGGAPAGGFVLGFAGTVEAAMDPAVRILATAIRRG
ncbi:PLP-dependent aminotransferase family protein [Nitrospirillum sp. BR 11163]|uniref:MocR-like pyridoxine biosynthesis transcription factor PdxR n=1 Tax=Nitrospirillum sp. BR 11163 TaxID=3104323 RepID=UPI002AFF6AE9|nr:PLP-dependent aminotransferase family protein [Nitrospirillum sp. BR 11163]MEA1673957.1 PLP-dependent aminotransferase family protein [Nitrospirillum sp. BR 11163]